MPLRWSLGLGLGRVITINKALLTELIRNLRFGASLELGFWDLELPTPHATHLTYLTI
jgi:hypothetical protein